MNIGELGGVKVMLSPEAYAEVKKQKIIEENKILKELQQELERYKNIIDEFDKWLEDNLGTCRTNQTYTSNQIYNLKEDIYYRCLNKLKELKGSDCNE